MKRTVTQIIAVTALALCSGAVIAENRHVNQDQMEDILYGDGVSASAGAPYLRVHDDRDHDNYLLYTPNETDQSSSFVAYVRVDDDRDHSEDQLYGSDFGQPGGLTPYVASQ